MGLLDDRIAIVTGRGIALDLAGEGERVTVIGCTAAKCERAVAEIFAHGGAELALLCHVGHQEAAGQQPMGCQSNGGLSVQQGWRLHNGQSINVDGGVVIAR